MVALVISGILVGVVFDLMLSQTRFARYQNAREEVQQNARTALELISGELRGVPAAAIPTAEANRITFRLPRAWGVLCHNVTAAITTVWVRFPAGVFPADFPTSASSSWGLAVMQPTTAVLPWVFVSSVGEPGGTNPCTANLLAVPGGSVFERSFSGTGFVLSASPALTAPAGSAVFVYQDVTYDVNTSSIPGFWIRRNTTGTPQPMAGPVPAASGSDAGLQLTYRDAAGVAIAPVTDANRLDIASIRLQVVANSRARFGGIAQRDTAFTEIYLRNR
jgi:type II secretory pathway pseudopilin PulG